MREICFSFTFQYGSINTRNSKRTVRGKLSLQSNMVLLIHDYGNVDYHEGGFTFQYGSINTKFSEFEKSKN